MFQPEIGEFFTWLDLVSRRFVALRLLFLRLQLQGFDGGAAGILDLFCCKGLPVGDVFKEHVLAHLHAAFVQKIDLADLPSSLNEIQAGNPTMGGAYSIEEIEAEHIRQVLARSKNLQQAATILKLDPTTLLRKRKSLNL